VVVADDSDERLGALLDAALPSRLGVDQVDARALLRGSRRRARQIRTQRIAALSAAAVLVVAVPVGYEVISPSSATSVQSGSTALLPSRSASRGALGPDRTISDALAFTAEELPRGLTLYWASAPSTGSPTTVNGQNCQLTEPAGRRPISGRQWLWSTNTGKLNDLGVTLTVTRWASGTGAQALAELAADTGSCRWSNPQVERSFGAAHTDGTWASTSSGGGLNYARSIIRVGDLIAGVEVQDPNGVAAAAVLADHLARIEAGRLA
jgi:hypothetical protein